MSFIKNDYEILSWAELLPELVQMIEFDNAGGIVTLIILVIVNKITRLRALEYDEMAGLDHSHHGEHGYGMLNPGR